MQKENPEDIALILSFFSNWTESPTEDRSLITGRQLLCKFCLYVERNVFFRLASHILLSFVIKHSDWQWYLSQPPLLGLSRTGWTQEPLWQGEVMTETFRLSVIPERCKINLDAVGEHKSWFGRTWRGHQLQPPVLRTAQKKLIIRRVFSLNVALGSSKKSRIQPHQDLGNLGKQLESCSKHMRDLT